MLRSFATFLAAGVATAVAAGLGAPPGTPSWTLLVGGVGAGFLASTVVILEESLAEDVLKGVIFGFIGVALLYLDVPGWVGWPLILGPWIGFLGNRGRGAPPESGPPHPDADGHAVREGEEGGLGRGGPRA